MTSASSSVTGGNDSAITNGFQSLGDNIQLLDAGASPDRRRGQKDRRQCWGRSDNERAAGSNELVPRDRDSHYRSGALVSGEQNAATEHQYSRDWQQQLRDR